MSVNSDNRIRDARVAAAFRAVPRDAFLPGVSAAQVARNEAIVTRWDAAGRPITSSSQPSMMAVMLEQLEVRPGDRILEIGAGTGYNAALLAHLAGSGGHVIAIDIDDEPALQARANLIRSGYTHVEVFQADGMHGWADGAPYDRIIVTASARNLAPAWAAQLDRAGCLVVPLSSGEMQRSVAFVHDGDHLISRSSVPSAFMPLRGPHA